jgi:hypothetical protein
MGSDDIIDDAIEEILKHADSLIDRLPEHLQKEVLERVRAELAAWLEAIETGGELAASKQRCRHHRIE